jgi:hypothetical protein
MNLKSGRMRGGCCSDEPVLLLLGRPTPEPDLLVELLDFGDRIFAYVLPLEAPAHQVLQVGKIAVDRRIGDPRALARDDEAVDVFDRDVLERPLAERSGPVVDPARQDCPHRVPLPLPRSVLTLQ